MSRVLGDGQRQSDRSLKGHEAGVRKGQPWAANHHPRIVAVYGTQTQIGLPTPPSRAVTMTPGADLTTRIQTPLASRANQTEGGERRNFDPHPVTRPESGSTPPARSGATASQSAVNTTMSQHPTSTPRMLPAAVLVVLVLVGVVSIVGPFAADADQVLKNQQAQGLAPITVPISTTSAPWLFATLGVPLLLMAGVLTLMASVRLTRWIAMACAGLKAVLVGGIGVAAFVYSNTPQANIHGLVALALFFFSLPLLIAGVAYLAAAFASRSRGLPWRVVGAIIDAGVSWFIALGVVLEAITQSQPSWGGSAGELIYDYPQYGSWPLVWACIFAAVWLGATVPVVVNAIPDHWLNRASVDTQDRSRLGPFRGELPIEP